MNPKYLGIGLIFAFLFACTSKEQVEVGKTSDASNKSEIVIPEPSELAQLMRRMFDENMQMRELILKGETPTQFSEEFYNLHSANATEPEKITDTYHLMGDAYLEAMNQILTADSDHSVEAFNHMVSACIACHESVSCQGPIPRIKKLRIKEDEA